MLPKDGDSQDVANWRPIVILPILYKLFVRLIYKRVASTLFGVQSRDQHAFTPKIRLEDALFCVEVATEFANEFNIPVWMISMAMRKAFDTIDHDALFQALHNCGIADEYISFIALLYSNQSGTVHGSRQFKISNGVKQGDISSLIFFNCVLDAAFDKWKHELQDEGSFLANCKTVWRIQGMPTIF